MHSLWVHGQLFPGVGRARRVLQSLDIQYECDGTAWRSLALVSGPIWFCLFSPTLSLYHVARTCKTYAAASTRDFHYTQMGLHLGPGLVVWRIPRFPGGVCTDFSRRQFPSGPAGLAKHFWARSWRAACVFCCGTVLLCSQALPCHADRRTDVYAKIRYGASWNQKGNAPVLLST